MPSVVPRPRIRQWTRAAYVRAVGGAAQRQRAEATAGGCPPAARGGPARRDAQVSGGGAQGGPGHVRDPGPGTGRCVPGACRRQGGRVALTHHGALYRWAGARPGVSAQRDLHSSHLARFVCAAEDDRQRINAGRAALDRPGAAPLPRAACEPGRRNNESTRGPVPRPRAARGRSGSHGTECGVKAGAGEVVAAAGGPAVRESPGEAAVCTPRLPQLSPGGSGLGAEQP